jgi:V8-like Glu-specific endopeptidase
VLSRTLLTAALWFLPSTLWADVTELLPQDAKVVQICGSEQTGTCLSPTWNQPNENKVVWVDKVTHRLPTDFIAVHFDSLINNSSVPWVITVSDSSGVEKHRISSADLSMGTQRTGLWTRDVSGSIAIVTVMADSAPIGLSFYLDKYIYESKLPATQSLQDKNNSKIDDISLFKPNSRYRSTAKAVAKIAAISGTVRYPCTGFMISREYLLTNEHCIPYPRPKGCENIIVIFGFERQSRQDEEEIVDCPTIEETNYPLDYAILKLDHHPGDRWGFLIFGEPTAQKNNKLFIIQHPNGDMKKITIQNCFTGAVPIAGRKNARDSNDDYSRQQDFQHTCDTEGGSSGSPVLDYETARVIGLHHYGVPPEDSVRFNQAVSISEIFHNVSQRIKSQLSERSPMMR